MGVVEKNLSNKVGRGNVSIHKESVKGYYFPEIPIIHTLNENEGINPDNTFQPIDLVEDDNCSISMPGLHPENGEFLDKIKEMAYEEGFRRGERDGVEFARKEFAPLLRNLGKGLLELRELRKQVYMDAEKDIVQLSLAIAGKIVCREVETDKELVLGVVKKALSEVIGHEKVIIRVNPSDLQFVKGNILETRVADKFEDVSFEEDERILKGGCVIETNLGDIDARIEKQLEALEEILNSEFQDSELSE